MDIKEAYKLLEVPEDISDDDLKKEYKKLAAKFHPDIHKSDPDKFKHINEAYQLIVDYRENPEKYNPRPHPFGGASGVGIDFIGDLFGVHRHGGGTQIKAEPIHLTTRISFKEHVLGTDKELQFRKNIRCDGCNGQGKRAVGNGCPACDGFGRVVKQQGNMVMQTGCARCQGKNVRQKDCDKCGNKGFLQVDTNIKAHIPPANSGVLRMQGGGNYAGNNMFGQVYTDCFLTVEVAPEPGLTLVGADVVSTLKLSMLEALEGCEKKVKTIYDKRIVKVPAGSRNKEELRLEGCGVKTQNGVQRIVFDVSYPDNVSELAEYLRGSK